MQDFYTENCKALRSKKKLKNEVNKEISHVHSLEDSEVIRMLGSSCLTYVLTQFQSEALPAFFRI